VTCSFNREAAVQTVEAIFENGTLRPLEPLEGIEEKARVRIAIEPLTEPHPLAGCFGILPDSDAAEMRRIVDEEFERIDHSAWQ
jgi:predicted DNA-binding antitoxin AbrB/MazE fold protein